MCDRVQQGKSWSLYRDVHDEAQRFLGLSIFEKKLKESMKKNDSSESTQSRDENEKEKCPSYDIDDIQDKIKKVDVKTSSPTSLLARSTLTLPTGVVKPIQSEQMKAKTKTMPSSGSATGRNV